MNNISVGSNVLIKRSDGRVHDALVSAKNDGTRSVTVEWFEKGETKGKEIDIEQLFALNPRLNDNNNGPPDSDEEKDQLPPLPADPIIESKGSRNPPKKQQIPTALNHKTTKTNRKTFHPNPDPPSRYNTTMVTNGHNFEDEENQSFMVAPKGTNGAAAAAANKRKSHTVQEIEKLKKNREERRAKQEEIKHQKEQLRNVDPGNPNWEFLSMVREYRDKLDFRPLVASDEIEDHKITVCVRKRPMNRKECAKKEVDVVSIPNKDHIIAHQPQTKVDLTKYLENQIFRFDYAFDENVNNDMVYRFSAQPLVKTIFEQGFATCFAYGQTGSGKTHTMGGDFTGKTQDVSKGIYVLTARDVFKLLNSREYKKEGLSVCCSFFEIYSGKVFDLLKNKAKLRILEDGKKEVQIVGLQEIPVSSEQEVLDLIRKGTDVRTAGQTSANNHSSRSHAIFQIILRKRTGKLHGKFSLIDLAGNERGADTMSWGGDRQARMEGAEINKSLLALKECIRAMGRNNPHLPFRASKLTLVLRDSFVGENSRTCMIAMISPSMSSCEHTLNTLRYADRVKELGTDDVENGGGGKRKPPELDYLMASSDSPNPSDSDLALLQSRNEDELSKDLYDFQLTVNHIQEAEERVMDEHSRLMDSMKKWMNELTKLSKSTEKVDYDIEGYALGLRSLLNKMPPEVKACSEQVENLLREMQAEEKAAQKAGNRKK